MHGLVITLYGVNVIGCQPMCRATVGKKKQQKREILCKITHFMEKRYFLQEVRNALQKSI